jgi:RNA recognition motif-containing protein
MGRVASRRRAISNKVFVGNLSFDVTREELIEAFSAAGRVVDAKVPTDRETGRPRGFAFVEFESDEAALRSIEQLNGRDLKGRPLRVNEAENRPPRPPGAPGFSRPAPGGGGGFSRPGGGREFSRPGGSGGGFSRPGAPGGTFPAPEETGDTRGRRFRQKPETKPAKKTSPRRRKDDVVEDDDEY